MVFHKHAMSVSAVVFVVALVVSPFHSVSALSSSAASRESSKSSLPPERLGFKSLEASAFRHPLDRQLTGFIQNAPFSTLAQEGLRKGLSLVEQGVRLDLLSSSVKVSPQQLPELHASLLEACDILDLSASKTSATSPPPELYIQSSSQANAYTLAWQGDDTAPIIVVTSALLDRCTDSEIQAVLGHELGHLKCEHSLYLTLGSLALTPILNLPIIGSRTRKTLEDWRLAAEYSCDRAAMLVAQDSKIVNGAMLKLVSGLSSRQQAMNVDAFVDQCVEYDNLLQSANAFVRASIQRQQRTHPLPVRRVAELEKWATSDEYKKILENGTSLAAEEEEDDEQSSPSTSDSATEDMTDVES